MRQMRYCGPLRELSGKTALVRPHEKDTENKCLAQFDGKDDWRVGPEHKLKHPETGALLCLDWHEFPPGPLPGGRARRPLRLHDARRMTWPR